MLKDFHMAILNGRDMSLSLQDCLSKKDASLGHQQKYWGEDGSQVRAVMDLGHIQYVVLASCLHSQKSPTPRKTKGKPPCPLLTVLFYEKKSNEESTALS
ncbi:hypothetical protein Ancab_034294 [Ancistrocladus abbreviatus]